MSCGANDRIFCANGYRLFQLLSVNFAVVKFGLFDTAGLTQYPYIVVIYKINVHSHQNSLESQRPHFLFVSKARTHNFFFIFRQCTYIVYIC